MSTYTHSIPQGLLDRRIREQVLDDAAIDQGIHVERITPRALFVLFAGQVLRAEHRAALARDDETKVVSVRGAAPSVVPVRLLHAQDDVSAGAGTGHLLPGLVRRGACGEADDGHVRARVGKTVLDHTGEHVHEGFLARTIGSDKGRERHPELVSHDALEPRALLAGNYVRARLDHANRDVLLRAAIQLGCEFAFRDGRGATMDKKDDQDRQPFESKSGFHVLLRWLEMRIEYKTLAMEIAAWNL